MRGILVTPIDIALDIATPFPFCKREERKLLGGKAKGPLADVSSRTTEPE